MSMVSFTTRMLTRSVGSPDMRAFSPQPLIWQSWRRRYSMGGVWLDVSGKTRTMAERIQVGLLNLLEERDVQIRGHKVRLPLDVFVVATANLY